MKRLLILLTGLLALPAWAGTGSLIKDEDMKAEPTSSAATVKRVAKGSAVEILARKGGWTEIKTAGKVGWVRILSVKTNASGASAADLAAFTSNRDNSQVVAVAGLRGLNEEDLKAAKFDAKELAAMDQFVASRAAAEQFAHSAGLVRRNLAQLPEPKTETKSNNSPWGDNGL